MSPLSSYEVIDVANGVVVARGTSGVLGVNRTITGLYSRYKLRVHTPGAKRLSLLQQSTVPSSQARAQVHWQRALVALQVAFAFVLVAGTAFSANAVVRALRMPLGFNPNGLVMASIVGEPATPGNWLHHQEEWKRNRGFVRKVFDEIAAEPGVSSVGFTDSLPFYGYPRLAALEIEQSPRSARLKTLARRNVVTATYFDTMGIPLLSGRGFTALDDLEHMPVALINRTLAELHFPGRNPIGHHLRFITDDPSDHDQQKIREIVGVVEDIHAVTGPPVAEVFYPAGQHWAGSRILVARAQNPDELMRKLPTILHGVEPALAARIATLDERIRLDVAESIRFSRLLGAFGAIALLLSVMSLYTLVSYSTARRSREFALRGALGSPPAGVVWLAMRDGLQPLALGEGLGVVGVMVLGKWFAAKVPQATFFDLTPLCIVAIALAATGCFAVLVPARRAARASVVTVLRGRN